MKVKLATFTSLKYFCGLVNILIDILLNNLLTEMYTLCIFGYRNLRV